MSQFYEFIVANIQSFDIVTKYPDPENGWDVVLFKEAEQDGERVSVMMCEVKDGEITNTHTLFSLTILELLTLCSQIIKSWGGDKSLKELKDAYLPNRDLENLRRPRTLKMWLDEQMKDPEFAEEWDVLKEVIDD